MFNAYGGFMKRIDSTSYLYHWVKSDPHLKNQIEDYENAYGTFIKILDDGILLHGSTIKTNGTACICFTESPEYFMHKDKSKYQPFGFKYLKRDVFYLGGRTVIYAPEYEKNDIDESMQWRYMRHDPFAITPKTPYGVDFTWEREWRLPQPQIPVLDAMAIIVPNEKYIQRVHDETEKWLNYNAQLMEQLRGYREPDPSYEDYIFSIRRALITPEKFE